MRNDHTKGKLIITEGNLDNKAWFKYTEKNFLHNVDTLYYSVHVSEDWYGEECQSFVKYLDLHKEWCYRSHEPVVVRQLGNDYVMNGFGFARTYAYDLEKKDCFVIFISKGRQSAEVPPILVQIRSQYLWLEGTQRAFEKSLDEVYRILSQYKITVKSVQENRIDYATHTNAIQNLMGQFSEVNLKRCQVSRFERARKEYDLTGADEEVSCDYVSFGRRKSNNIFFRAYDKTQEVVNQGYKQFFLKLWLLEGLISRYDFWCLEKCFLHGDYCYRDKARLEFYIEYGADPDIKADCRKLLEAEFSDPNAISLLANQLTPRITKVVNFEFQCKRKFFLTMDFKNDLYQYNKTRKSIDRVMRHHNLIYKYLTHYVLRFVDHRADFERKRDKPTAKWWVRLQNIKIDISITAMKSKLVREYQKNIDIEMVKKKTISGISTWQLYRNLDSESSVMQDGLEFLTYLNESDIQEAMPKKMKKSRQLRQRLSGLEEKAPNQMEQRYAVIDCTTGEIVESINVSNVPGA